MGTAQGDGAPSGSDGRDGGDGAGRLDRALAAAFGPRGPAGRPVERDAPLPERVGPYRVLGLIGRGAMGVVYEAEEDRPRRRVALKVLRVDPHNEAFRARFRREADLLARLDHPGVARVLAVGEVEVAGEPRPYIAMERVEGVRLDVWVRERGLDLAQRIELLARVADAVQHAHHKGVLHRDVKPSNVVVDADGQPHLVDFGIARDLELGADASLATGAGEVLGTLAYSSPEQRSGDPGRVDTRSDVYALGVVLYELLCGRLPVDVSGLSATAALRALDERTPPRPSSIDRRLAGDVDVILARALAPEPDRRYGSAAELAADLRRHLAREPILARPATLGYRLSRFVRRRPALALALSAFALSTVGGVAATAVYAVRADDARAAADLRAEQRERIGAILADVIGASSPFLGGPDTKVADVLQQTELRLARVPEDPAVEVPVRVALARAYRELALYPQATRQVDRALELARAHPEVEPLDALRARSEQARVVLQSGEAERGLVLARAVAADWERLAPEERETSLALGDLVFGLTATGRSGEAVRLAEEVVDRRIADFGEDDLDTGRGMYLLARALEADDRSAEAESWARRSVATLEALVGPSHPHVCRSKLSLAAALRRQDRFDEAYALFDEVLAATAADFGPEHELTGFVHAERGTAAYHDGRLDEAEASLTRAREIYEAVRGPDDRSVWTLRHDLAVVARLRGDLEAAERELLLVLEARRRLDGPLAGSTASTLHALSVVHQREERFDRMVAVLEPLLEADRAAFGERHANTWDTMARLARALTEVGRREEAAGLLEELVRVRSEVEGADSEGVAELRATLAELAR